MTSGHAHFGSATNLAGTVLEVLIGLTFARLAFFHLASSKIPLVRGLGRAGMVQTG